MELCHGKSLPSHWEEADGWQQCINAGLRVIDKNGIDAVLSDLRARGEI
jgi:hypothetical protein